MPASFRLLLLAAYSATSSLSFASLAVHPNPLVAPAAAGNTAKVPARMGAASFLHRRDKILTVRGGALDESGAEAGGDVEESAPPAPAQASKGGGKMGPNAPPPGFLRSLLPNFPWHSLPNVLTYLRCVAIPVLVWTFYQSGPLMHVWTSTLFAVASLTDFLDGYLARRWDITSAFGAFLDPVADKLMVSTALVLLSGRYGASVAVPSAVILAREISVSALREWMAQRGKRDSVKVGMQGKVKTAATMVALTMLLAVPAGEGGRGALAGDKLTEALYRPSMALLLLSAVVTVTSGSVYFRAAAPVLMGDDE